MPNTLELGSCLHENWGTALAKAHRMEHAEEIGCRERLAAQIACQEAPVASLWAYSAFLQQVDKARSEVVSQPESLGIGYCLLDCSMDLLQPSQDIQKTFSLEIGMPCLETKSLCFSQMILYFAYALICSGCHFGYSHGYFLSKRDLDCPQAASHQGRHAGPLNLEV